MKHKSLFVKITFIFLLIVFGCHQQNKQKKATPDEIISTKTLGLAYLEENKLDKAEAEFLKLVKLSPKEVAGYANLGLVYLRMGKYPEAEKWLKKAVELDPKNPDVLLILSKVYELSNQRDKAIATLEESLKYTPDHVKSIYTLAELYSSLTDKNSLQKRYQYTRKLVDIAPANIVPRLSLIDILIHNNQADQALAQLEDLRKVFPDFPKEAMTYYQKTITALRKKNIQEAGTSFMIFHNYLKVTPMYQAGILKLKGPQGFIGSPVITFDQNKTVAQAMDWESVLAAIHFTDITSSAWADVPKAPPESQGNEGSMQNIATLAAGDYDGDGDIDLYTSIYNPESHSFKHYLLNNEWGKFHNVAAAAGITHEGKEYAAKFDDYNNDGYLDLYIVKDGASILYKNTGTGSFINVTDEAGVGDKETGYKSLFFDYDHDGDLDLYIVRPHTNLLYRNNADGSFTDRTTEANLGGGDVCSRDAAFGDFDDDGDIDLFVVNENASNILFSNQRQGKYKDVTEKSRLKSAGGSNAVTVGDYNNDGFLDLFVASSKAEQCRLYRNQGDGSFVADKKSRDLEKFLQNVQAYDALFLDIDNDGFLDLLVVGKSLTAKGKGVFLFHNDASGKFFITQNILPEDLTSGRKIIPFDYNEDGDMDVAIAGTHGGIRLLRNDGGNNLHYLKMKLVGLRTGSGKNNYYGIGAKIEVRAGNLYQSAVVTSPEVLFGLGTRTKADVIRILWTNGVPQNIFFPHTDQDLVEQQQLKGSCPFLYTWDGKQYVFVKDIMWRSALGMPLGIMGEDKATKYASSAPSVDYIKIPGELLKPQNHTYNIQVTDELWEAIYFDQVQLIAVDHPDSVDVYVDERFMPSPVPGYKLYQAGRKHLPVAATDKAGDNLLPLILKKDDQYISTMNPTQYQGITEMSDLYLQLGKVDRNKNLILYLNGWIFPSDASINAAIAQSGKIKLISPYLQVLNKQGKWVTIVDNLSFPMGKDKTIVADLTGKIPTYSDVQLRIRTNMEIYWDYIFYTNDNVSVPVRTKVLNPCSADLHYRGFSRTFRKGGRYGPHWFDYSQVTTDPKWRDQAGNYTRYGDVLPLLTAADDKYIIKNAGDETSIAFTADSLPVLPEGWKRDFLIHTVGWVKDADMNTATGNTVAPLPFHAMTRYPYGSEESYPTDREHQQYLKEYNTRIVTARDFQRAIVRKTDRDMK
ncbi:MAG: VCBS repeat-containing protein [Bacteroidales bacterium]|nr:VCBS repeat-containing protein [Bacteroidales bacterium]